MRKTPLAALAVCLLVPVSLAFAADKEVEIPWSFTPLKRPAVPAPTAANWPKNDIDRFILARLETEGLRPNADADRRTFIRRAAFDLTGLPPTPEEIANFLSVGGSEENAFARVIDSYLESPRFGERWARHWLDVARYADSVGRTWNAPFTYAFRYRDWVIDSFNQDKPYNRFVAEQLAGDLLPAKTVEQRREQVLGTGFLTLGAMTINNGSIEPFYMDQIDDQIDVTSRAFLGVTIACARCHDHKYDPIATKDYYALAGIFYSSWTLPGQAHIGDLTANGYVDPEMLLHLPTDLATPVSRVKEVPAGIHSMGDIQALGGGAKRPPNYDYAPDFAMGVMEGKTQNCAIRVGGDAFVTGEVPKRGEIAVPGLPPLPPIPEGASGRLELAQWITTPTHPLTARVLVNRVWQHLFGQGLVNTVDDFGTTGLEPSHPALLDHLAIQFVENGWSIKELIRSMMMSRTYRLSGTGQAAGLEKDPGNTLHWRMSPRRLEFEPIRDSMLQAAGLLEFERPEGIQVAGMGGKGRTGQTISLLNLESPYRTIYLPVLRDLLPDVYGTFDFPDPTQIKGQRFVTTTPPQSLFMLNSEFAARMAQETAARLLEEKGSDKDRIARLYVRLLGREPDLEEANAALTLMRDLDSSQAREPEIYRWSTLVQAIMAGAEFRYVL